MKCLKIIFVSLLAIIPSLLFTNLEAKSFLPPLTLEITFESEGLFTPGDVCIKSNLAKDGLIYDSLKERKDAIKVAIINKNIQKIEPEIKKAKQEVRARALELKTLLKNS